MLLLQSRLLGLRFSLLQQLEQQLLSGFFLLASGVLQHDDVLALPYGELLLLSMHHKP